MNNTCFMPLMIFLHDYFQYVLRSEIRTSILISGDVLMQIVCIHSYNIQKSHILMTKTFLENFTNHLC